MKEGKYEDREGKKEVIEKYNVEEERKEKGEITKSKRKSNIRGKKRG